MQYGKEFKGYILAVSKQDPPEVAAIEFRENDIEFEMHDLKLNIERIEQVKNGEIVEIITSKERKNPNRDWLRFTVTSEAKTHIRRALKKDN